MDKSCINDYCYSYYNHSLHCLPVLFKSEYVNNLCPDRIFKREIRPPVIEQQPRSSNQVQPPVLLPVAASIIGPKYSYSGSLACLPNLLRQIEEPLRKEGAATVRLEDITPEAANNIAQALQKSLCESYPSVKVTCERYQEAHSQHGPISYHSFKIIAPNEKAQQIVTTELTQVKQSLNKSREGRVVHLPNLEQVVVEVMRLSKEYDSIAITLDKNEAYRVGQYESEPSYSIHIKPFLNLL